MAEMSVREENLFSPFPLADQQNFESELAEAFRRVLGSGRYILDAEVTSFEQEFGAFLGAQHVIGVANGTDAIELMLRALNVGVNSQVVIPALAPSAVAAGVARSGAQPVFADIQPDTFTLCPDSVDEILSRDESKRIKAILAVHLYGHPADWAKLSVVARKHGVVLLEDCAQAHGAVWCGKMAGGLGLAAAFSFYPTKNLGALGDAGALVTNDPEVARQARLIRQYGWRVRFVSELNGINSRLDELQAAFLRVKLRGLQGALVKRRTLAATYTEGLREERALQLPVVRPGCVHAYHQYVVRTQRRQEFATQLHEMGIPVQAHSPVPLHRQPAYYQEVTLPESERAAREVLPLPIHPYLGENAVRKTCEAIIGALHAKGRS